MKNKETLKSLELYSEESKAGKSYFLKAIYEIENQYVKNEIVIPKIALPLCPGEHVIHKYESHSYSSLKVDIPHTIDIGFGDLPMMSDDHGRYYYEVTVAEYPQKMTLSEIEKKLGYKVEIVSEKPDAK